ncbi:MAG: DUF1493 family protein [Cryomorphaceae bacterium]|nr:DUF1493 family protein [Cryomorphaceae bacterium]
MKNDRFEDLKFLVKEVYGFRNIDENTCLNDGRTISEDNDVFINELKSRFNIDMQGFKYYDYFDEDEFVLLNIFRLLMRRIKLLKNNKKRLTVGHIHKVIQQGKWFDPVS